MDVIEGCIILLDLFYRQPVYIGDGYVEYECIELNTTMVWEKYFSSFRNVSKGLINLNATFSWSLDEVLTMLLKPRKPRSADEIIALMHDKCV